jgi:ribosomal protein S12 methylthiotransferase accessory factor YcaO
LGLTEQTEIAPPFEAASHIVNADRTVPFAQTIRDFEAALGKRCRFKVRARRYYGTVWISDCYTDYKNPALFRQYEGPLMEGEAMRTMGKGLNKQQVSAGALAEAIERLSLFYRLEQGGNAPVYELTEDLKLVPAMMPDDVIEHLNQTADGVSAGNNVLECVLHGLLEMYEHLDVCLHLGRFGLGHRQFIDPALTGFHPVVSEKMLAVAVPGENPKVTTIHAIVCPKDIGPFVRSCAHLDGKIALQRAFNETLQSHKTRSVHDLQPFAPELHVVALQNHHTDDLETNIRTVLEALPDTVYVQDWTDPIMKVPVMRPFTMRMLETKPDEHLISEYVQSLMNECTNYVDWEA